MQRTLRKLRKKGWSGKEIRHAERIFLKAAQRKHPVYRFLERAVFWALLALTLVAVFTVNVVVWIIAPFLSTGLLTTVLVLFGLVFGSLYTIVAGDIDWLEQRHHALASALLATAAIVTSTLIGNRLAVISALAQLPPRSTVLPGIAFALALLAPHFLRTSLEAEVGG